MTRRAPRACEGAEWGKGAPRATEPGYGAKPHLRRTGEINLSFIDPADRPVSLPARVGDAANRRPKWCGQHRMAQLRCRSGQHAILISRSNQRGQLQESRNRLAFQN